MTACAKCANEERCCATCYLVLSVSLLRTPQLSANVTCTKPSIILKTMPPKKCAILNKRLARNHHVSTKVCNAEQSHMLELSSRVVGILPCFGVLL